MDSVRQRPRLPGRVWRPVLGAHRSRHRGAAHLLGLQGLRETQRRSVIWIAAIGVTPSGCVR